MSTLRLNDMCGEFTGGADVVDCIDMGDARDSDILFLAPVRLMHSSRLLLPGAMNIDASTGDFALFRATADGVRCVYFARADGLSVAEGQRVLVHGAAYDDRALRQDIDTAKQQLAQIIAHIHDLEFRLSRHSHETIRHEVAA